MASQLENGLCCIKHYWSGHEQSSTVNSVSADDWSAKLAIIASQVFNDSNIFFLLFLQELFDNATEKVTGPVRFAHQWVNVSDVTVTFNGSEVSTCRPSMGFSFAAGIPDGPGIPPFTNGKH